MNLFNLTGKRALITGGTHGLGMAMAEGLAQAGAELVITGTTPSKMEDALHYYRSKGYKASGYLFDVTNEKAAAENIDLIAKELGDIHILVNNAGIIKREIPVIVSSQTKEAAKVILAKAIENNSPIMREGIELDVLERSVGIGGQQLTIANPYGTHSELFLPLFGKHQASNAAVALTAVEAFIDRQIDHDLVQEAFAEFSSPGRLQILKRNPTIVIDAAHNPAGIRATKQGINESFQFDNLIFNHFSF